MNTPRSIRYSILISVTVSMMFLGGSILFLQSQHELERLHETTRDLVSEQISLTVKKLDAYRIINQVNFISGTIFRLDKVEAISIFDKNCALLKKQPINHNLNWDCKKSFNNDEYILYNVENVYSNSPGAPKYIIAKIRFDESALLSVKNLKILFLILSLTLLTLILLLFLMKKQILYPLKSLKSVISKNSVILNNKKIFNSLPQELRPIYESVVERDKVIQESQRKILEQKEAKAVAELSRSIGHNLQSPLKVIQKLIHEDLDPLYHAAFTSLEKLTGELLESSHDRSPLVLNTTIKEVIDSKKVEYDGLEIDIDFKDSTTKTPVILADSVKFKAVLSNLINNAQESIPQERVGEISITLSDCSHHYKLEIQDNGIGIKDEDIKKVFQKGISIGKPQGNGLGLSHAKETINFIGGRLSLRSAELKGTTVTLELPPYKKSNFETQASPVDLN